MTSNNYEERFYRRYLLNNSLIKFNITVAESDLLISAKTDVSEVAHRLITKYRTHIINYIYKNEVFLTSLRPLDYDELAPPIVRDMLKAAIKTNTGPMASVAGAIAEYVGMELLKFSQDIIIENGGDIFLKCNEDIKVGVFTGDSPFRQRISFKIKKSEMPLGICTSSGKIGHSLSFGSADAACVKAKSAILADAAATAIGNMIKKGDDIYKALHFGMKIDGVTGIVIVKKDKLGVIGDVDLI